MKHLLQLGVIMLCLVHSAHAAPIQQSLERIPLTITASDGKTHVFQVEIAQTRAQKMKGLMFREQLGKREGMLFLHPEPRLLSMWMKNTLIPLDILFIRADDTISSIHPNAQPHSLQHIHSKEKVRAVLEINGGMAHELGLKPGALVTW